MIVMAHKKRLRNLTGRILAAKSEASKALYRSTLPYRPDLQPTLINCLQPRVGSQWLDEVWGAGIVTVRPSTFKPECSIVIAGNDTIQSSWSLHEWYSQMSPVKEETKETS